MNHKTPPPKTAQIEVTNKCNLRCQMCPLSDENYSPMGKPLHVSLAEFKLLLDRLPASIESVSLQGLGEPLLNRELPEIIRYAKNQGKAVSFFTNSTLLTKERASMLCETGLNHLVMSLDGGTKETFENIRKGASFESVVENIHGMSAVKATLGSNSPTLQIMVVGMKENISEIPLIIDIAHSAGVPSVTVKNLYEGEGIAGEPLTKEDIRYLEETCAKYAVERGITFSHPRDAAMDNQTIERTCRWLWDATYVTANGFVTPCCFSYEGDFKNLLDTPFESIWNGDFHTTFRRELLEGLPDICSKCPAYGIQMVSHSPEA